MLKILQNKLEEAKKIYNNLSQKGKAFYWHHQNNWQKYIFRRNKELGLKLISTASIKLPIQDIYDTFDYAELLKNNENLQVYYLLHKSHK